MQLGKNIFEISRVTLIDPKIEISDTGKFGDFLHVRRDKNQSYVAQSFNFSNEYFYLEIVYIVFFIIYKYSKFRMRFKNITTFLLTIKIINLKKNYVEKCKINYLEKNTLFAQFRYEE